MAQPRVEIQIAAVDRASAVLNKVGGVLQGVSGSVSKHWDNAGVSLVKAAAGVYALQ